MPAYFSFKIFLELNSDLRLTNHALKVFSPAILLTMIAQSKEKYNSA